MFDVAAWVQKLAVTIPVFLLALTIHEFAHGWVANRLGDPTARLNGRLTLNPLAHLDVFGTIAIILINFGWAKPVPVDYRYLRNPRRDSILIALAGPISNLLLAAATAFLFQAIPWNAWPKNTIWLAAPLYAMLRGSVYINVILAVFNLIPIPPLDGSRVVSGLLPLRQALAFSRLEPYGFLIIFFLFYSGIVNPVFGPVVHLLTLGLLHLWG